MILYVWQYQNGTFEKISVIDYATSIIWTKRHQDAGDFELYIAATPELLEMFTQDEIFLTKDDDPDKGAMCVENIQLETDAENGDYLTITGRSAESIIGRRIVPAQTLLRGTAERAIFNLMVQNIIAPLNPARKMQELTFGTLHGWAETIEQQITGKNLFDAIRDICVSFNYGFNVRFTGSQFVLNLFKPVDRSFDQTENPFVIFSPEFDNLGNTEYSRDKSSVANAVYVAGQGQGSDRVIVNVTKDGAAGFSRRELWVDSRNSSTTTDEGELTPTEYAAMLRQQGAEELELSRETVDFSGEILDVNGYVYGVDYNLGDKIAIKNEYGVTGAATVKEITEVEDESGYRIYPTLSEWSV